MNRTAAATFLLLLAHLLPVLSRAQAPAVPVRTVVPEKVCQLTGDVDWTTGAPTAARTLANFGLDAVDLGYPVEHFGKLVLLFGDAWPPTHGLGPMREITPDDAVGETKRTEPPTPESCLDMIVHSRVEHGQHRYDPATIIGPVRVMQGFFNVPSGGVTVGKDLYGFFWTHHCMAPGVLNPDPEHPLARPAPTSECPQTEERNSLGSGVLARSTDGGFTFTHPVAMPDGFAYSTAVNATWQHDLPEEQKLGVYIFGVPRYRASVPYLAVASVESFDNLATWRFFNGLDAQGRPIWVNRTQWHPGPAAQIYTPLANFGYNVGEFSITWNEPLHLWLLMYAGVALRAAHAPWGPWSLPATILGPEDHLACWITMAPHGCGNRRDYWPQRHPDGHLTVGGLYAPFILNRYTRPGPEPNSATIYFTLSTWNPYEVSIMRVTVKSPPVTEPTKAPLKPTPAHADPVR